jgi:adenosylcobinamide-GDP ribazoletransferase
LKRLLVGISFLSRIPVPGALTFDGTDVGRATVFFPGVGALLGGLMAGARWLFFPVLPATLAAILVVAVGAALTGALHLDGLADMADGFGGGRSRDDVLRIMRDHGIGAYGAVALILLLAIKVAAISTLIERGQADSVLVVVAALGRWGPVPLGRWLPYARKEGGGLGMALVGNVGSLEITGATILAVALAVGVLGARGAVILAAIALLTAAQGWVCMRRIGGITGDTLGANTETAEALGLVLAVAFG